MLNPLNNLRPIRLKKGQPDVLSNSQVRKAPLVMILIFSTCSRTASAIGGVAISHNSCGSDLS